MINCTSMPKNKIELSWPIKAGAVYDENKTEQRHDRSYKCILCRKQYWIIMINCTEGSLWRKIDSTTTWLIIQVWYMQKKKLEFLWWIWLGVVYDENQIEQWCDRMYRWGLHEKRYFINVADRTRCRLWRKPNKSMTWLIIQMQSTMKTQLNYYAR